jgi:hypothetical protein
MRYLHEFNPIRSGHFRGHPLLEWIGCSRIWNGESKVVGVVLEDLHVAGKKITQVPPDDVQLIQIRFAGPQRFALQKLTKIKIYFQVSFISIN